MIQDRAYRKPTRDPALHLGGEPVVVLVVTGSADVEDLITTLATSTSPVVVDLARRLAARITQNRSSAGADELLAEHPLVEGGES